LTGLSVRREVDLFDVSVVLEYRTNVGFHDVPGELVDDDNSGGATITACRGLPLIVGRLFVDGIVDIHPVIRAIDWPWGR